MAATTGPLKSLPGSIHPVPKGAMCDNHPERFAITRIQGETDSTHAELIDCCEACAAKVRDAALMLAVDLECDGCHTASFELKNYRNPDEGVAGRLYQLCPKCIQEMHSGDNPSTGIADETGDGFPDENALEVDPDQDSQPDFGEQPTDFVDLDHIGPFDVAPRKKR